MGECYIYFKEKNGDSQFIQNHAALMSTVKSKWFNLFDYNYLSDLNTICSLWIAKKQIVHFISGLFRDNILQICASFCES